MNTTWCDLTIDTTQATLTQNLSPTLVLQTSLYGQILDGFQSNPYRRVRVGPNEPQEHMPTTRARGALLTELTPEKSTLEDIFVDLVKASPDAAPPSSTSKKSEYDPEN